MDGHEDNDEILPPPKVTTSQLLHSAFADVDQGSTFTLQFGTAHARPRHLDWIGASTAEQWQALLLIKTPLGQVFQQGKARNTLFDLVVIDKHDRKTEMTNQPAEYILPHTAISSTVDLREIHKEQERRLKKGQDTSKLPQRFFNLNGVYRDWTTDELKDLIDGSNKDAVSKLLAKYSVRAYGFFCYTVKIWDQYNDNTVRLRKGLRILRGGLQMASDNMPQGELIAIPLTSSIGYQNQMHVVIHFRNAEPDLGRKGFQPELVELASEIAVSCAGLLKKWRQNLKADTGVAPSIISETELSNWIQEQVDHEKSHPIRINNEHFFLPLQEVSITSEPKCEQDVIVLFNQLIAGGVIRGIKLLAASQTSRYDAVYRFHMQEPNEESHISSHQEPAWG